MKSQKEFNLLVKLCSVCENRGFKEVGNKIIADYVKRWENKFDESQKDKLLALIDETPEKVEYKKYKDIIGFLPESKYENVCIVCRTSINMGDPIFIKNNKALHVICGDDEAKKNVRFQKWLLGSKNENEKIEDESEPDQSLN